MKVMNSLLGKWFKLSDKIRFIFIGGVNTVVSYLIFTVLIGIIGHSYTQICVMLQWCISSVFSFLNQKFFVFCSRGKFLKEYIKCCHTWILSYIINVYLLEIFTHKICHNIYVSQFVSLTPASVMTYLFLKYYAFRFAKSHINT